MPLIRNPFRKAVSGVTQVSNKSTDSFHSIFMKENSSVKLNDGSSSPISFRREDEEPEAFKLSVVNDSGVFIPPSPPEHKSCFWHRKEHKGSRTADRTSLDEPFTISRESFESYRRSFDISARSPIVAPSRQSLDSGIFPQRISLDSKTSEFSSPVSIDEAVDLDDGLEEVELNEQSSTRARKRGGIFSSKLPAHTGGGLTFKFTMRKDSASLPQDNELVKIPVRTTQEEVAVIG